MKNLLATLFLCLGVYLPLGAYAQASGAQSNAQGNPQGNLPLYSDYRLPTLRESANIDDRTIGIAYANDSLLHTAMLGLDAELARQGSFRIVPLAVDNQLQSLYDLLFLRGVDAAVINADVIHFVANSGGYDAARNLVGSLASVSSEVLTFIARDDINSIDDLKGKTIALDRSSPENTLSTVLIMSALGIESRYLYLPGTDILNSLRNGTVDATLISLERKDADSQPEFMVAQQPTALTALDGLNVLPVPVNNRLSNIYTQVYLTHEELTGLIDPAARIPALQRDVVLASYRWRESSPRRENMVRFTEALLIGSERLASMQDQNLWNSPDFLAQIPGVRKLDIHDSALAIMDARRLANERAEEAYRIEQLTRQIEGEKAELLARLNDELVVADAVQLQRLLNELEVFLVSLKQ